MPTIGQLQPVSSLDELQSQYPDVDIPQFVEYADQDGISTNDLAKYFNIKQGRAWYIRAKISLLRGDVKDFDSRKTDFLNYLQMKTLISQDLVREDLMEREYVKLSNTEKIFLLKALQAGQGIAADKIRDIVNIIGNINVNNINMSADEIKLMSSDAIRLAQQAKSIPSTALTLDAHVTDCKPDLS